VLLFDLHRRSRGVKRGYEMKKIVAVAVFLFAVAVTGIFGAEVTSKRLPFRLNEYIRTFADNVQPDANKERISLNYYRYVIGNNKSVVAQFAQLDEDQDRIDTAIEWLCASYYHVAVRDIRPQEAAAILPADNPKLADLEIGTVIFQEIQILHFLGNTATKGRYEGILKFITDRKNVTRAEIEECYRNSIRGLIAGIVDEEFNKISFFIENIIEQKARSYGGILTRNPQNGYLTLSYERPTVQNSRKELTAQTLDALLAAMRDSKDFSQDAINTVSTQAKLIPAAVLTSTALTEITDIITRFYTEPDQSTYTAVLEARRVIGGALHNTSNLKYTHVSDSYARVLAALNRDFAEKVFVDARNIRSNTILTRDQQQRLIQLR
jgi:hypothetical protein